MKNERTVYTTGSCFLFTLFSSCNRKNENGYNGSYFYFSFFVWGLEKRKRMLGYPFSIFYYEIEKRKTKGRYIHGPGRTFHSHLKLLSLPWHTCTCLWTDNIASTRTDIFAKRKHRTTEAVKGHKNILISRQSDLISRQTIQVWIWYIAAGTTMGLHYLVFTNYRFGGDRDRTKLWGRPACINVDII